MCYQKQIQNVDQNVKGMITDASMQAFFINLHLFFFFSEQGREGKRQMASSGARKSNAGTQGE